MGGRNSFNFISVSDIIQHGFYQVSTCSTALFINSLYFAVLGNPPKPQSWLEYKHTMNESNLLWFYLQKYDKMRVLI